MKWLTRSALIFIWVALLFSFLRIEKNDTDQKSLNVFAWGNCFSTESINRFTEKTGIKVNLSHYASNEELITKLSALDGKGYDLIIPSDYAVDLLRAQNLLKKIDKVRIDRFDKIDPFLLGHKYDMKNQHSIPYQWDVLGVGYNENLTEKTEFSLRDIFENNGSKTAMTNDSVEAVNLAAFYLFGRTNNISTAETKKIQELLKKQKSWIEAYTTMRADYILATENVPLALSMSSYMLDTAKNDSSIKFSLPKEGTFLSIESFALPIGSNKEDQAYELINFLMEDREMKENCDRYSCFPATPQEELSFDEVYTRARKTLEDERYPRLFYNHIIPERVIRSIWIKTKS